MHVKTVFLTGKGGVGKSTMSAALARQLADRGRRVLAVSLDPAHNLGDLFGVEVGDRPLAHGANLRLREVDVERAARKTLADSAALLRETYRYTETLRLDRAFDVLRYSPGIEEYAALVVLEEVLREERDTDVIVFDTPPTGLTLRILALPQVTLLWLDRLLDVRRRILEKRYTIRRIAGPDLAQGGERLVWREADDRVTQKLRELQVRYRRLREALCGPHNAVGVVFNPDELSWRESNRLVTGLKNLAVPVRLGICNRFTEAWRAGAERNEERMRTLLGGAPVIRVSSAGGAMPGPEAIREDLTSWFVPDGEAADVG